MDQRREPRFETNQPVMITNLDDPDLSFPGRLADFSANGTCLVLDRKIQVGSVIKVLWGKTILFGEVIYCLPDGIDFRAGLELEDAIYDTRALSMMGEGWRETAPAAAEI